VHQRIKTVARWLFNPRSISLGFAVFNFILIWLKANEIATSGIACIVCPWYYPWSYLNEPSFLLLATIFLRLNRAWAYSVALLLSGYVVGNAVYLFVAFDSTLAQEWRYLQKFEPYFVGSWHSQIVFGAVVLFCSIWYLARAILRRNSLPSGGG
jgi:hypothetical protein